MLFQLISSVFNLRPSLFYLHFKQLASKEWVVVGLRGTASMVIFGWHLEKNYSRTILKSASLGEALARAWPKLTKQEQEKILRFGQEL